MEITAIQFIASFRLDESTDKYTVTLLSNGDKNTMSSFKMYHWLKANGYRMLRGSNKIAKIA